MYIQKAFKNGNSVVVTLPKQYLRDFKIRDGSEIVVTKNTKGVLLFPKRPSKKLETSQIVSSDRKIAPNDKEFKRWWDAFLKENAGILDELAVR